MPTKQRRAREEAKRHEMRKLDEAVTYAPPHVKSRLKAPGAVVLPFTPQELRDLTFGQFDEAGQFVQRENPPERGANNDRHKMMVAERSEFKQRWSHVWGVRGWAKRIAHEEGCGVETIRRYMRDDPA